MMKKLAAAVLLFSAAFCMTAHAEGWEQRNGLWYYDLGDGRHPANEWLWLDGDRDGVAQCYYFDANGYMYYGRTTPDGYYVDEDGAWTKMGIVQEREVSTGTEYADDGLLKDLHTMAHNTRSENREQFIPEKEYDMFDIFEGDIKVFYDESDQFVYLTKHSTEDSLSPIRGIDITVTWNDDVWEQFRDQGYNAERETDYLISLPLADGLTAQYRPDSRFLIVEKAE